MSEFKYKYSQILTLISQAKKENRITDDEKIKMKECVLLNEPDLTVEMEQYNKDKDLSRLIETLKVVAGITDMSSPLDNNLSNAKRNRAHKKKRNKKDKEEKHEEDKGFEIDECDLGNSPEIIPKKLK